MGKKVEGPVVRFVYSSSPRVQSTTRRMYRTVRAVASADAAIGSLRSAGRPKFLCLNASNRSLGAGVTLGARGKGAQRFFSETRCIRAGAAEAV